ncbi:MAG: hypothetical protein IJD10_04415, partial [Clostridia bacterium]|nr:hypothetical protein [Clostridia bacterium]
TAETGDYYYRVGPEKNYFYRDYLPWRTVRTGDVYYLNMTQIAHYCDLATTGDDTAIRYIVKKTGESVEFLPGQSVAYVNGSQERMSADAYVKGGNLYVPFDFINRCIEGVTATIDTENNRIVVMRDTDKDGDPLAITFPYKVAVHTEGIRFSELDNDLQIQIMIQNQPPEPEPELTPEPPSDGEAGTATEE